MRNGIHFGLLLLTFFLLHSFTSKANCPTPEQLYAEFQSIIKTSTSASQIDDSIEKWRIRWEACYPITDSVYVNTLTFTGLNYYRKGNIEEAIKWHEKALDVFKQNKGLRLKLSSLVKIYYRLGAFYTNSQKLNESTQVLHALISAAGTHPELRSWVNQAHLYLIYNYYVLGDFERALQHASAGEILSRQLDDKVHLSKVLQQKAQVLHSLKRYEEALTTVNAAIPLLDNLPQHSSSLSSQYMLKGNILRDLKQNDEALQSLQKGYQIAKEYGEQHVADFPIAIGYFYQMNQQYPLAIHYFQEALQLDDGTHNKCLIYNNLANIHKRKKDFPKAIEFLHLGLQTILPDLEIEGSKINLRAESIKTLQQKEYLLGLTRDYAETWLEFAQAENQNPDYLHKSLDTYMLADSMIDLMRWQHTGTSSKLYWREQTSEMYEQAIGASFLSQDVERAFYFFEKSRAILLNDELNSLGAVTQLKEDDLNRDKEIRQQISELQEQLSQKPPQSTDYLKLVDQLVKVENQQKALIEEWKDTNPTYYHYRYNNSVPTIKEMQQQVLRPMGANSAFLTYYIGEKNIYGICITYSTTQFTTLSKPKYDSLLLEINRFLPNKALQNQSYKQFLQHAYDLQQLLVASFKIAPESRIIISTNNDFFPFEILSLSPTKPLYWGLTHAISYTYSGNFLLKKQHRKKEHQFFNNYIGIAPVTFSSQLNQAALLGSDVATKIIRSLFPFSDALLHQKATKRAFLEKAPKYKMVQLITHAIADSTESEPTLYFADSTLLLSDISSNELSNTQLIVLSACQTGIGKFQTGEGIYSLARGFAATGIPSTVTTLWSVENQPIYQLTTLFFRHLQDGQPLDVALLNARKEWVKNTHGVDQLPYMWAGMVLIGNVDPIALYISKRFTMGLLTIVLLGMFFTILYYYRRHTVQKQI